MFVRGGRAGPEGVKFGPWALNPYLCLSSKDKDPTYWARKISTFNFLHWINWLLFSPLRN